MSMAEELANLADLHTRGILSTAEFESAKAQVLAGVGSASSSATGPAHPPTISGGGSAESPLSGNPAGTGTDAVSQPERSPQPEDAVRQWDGTKWVDKPRADWRGDFQWSGTRWRRTRSTSYTGVLAAAGLGCVLAVGGGVAVGATALGDARTTADASTVAAGDASPEDLAVLYQKCVARIADDLSAIVQAGSTSQLRELGPLPVETGTQCAALPLTGDADFDALWDSMVGEFVQAGRDMEMADYQDLSTTIADPASAVVEFRDSLYELGEQAWPRVFPAAEMNALVQ